MHRGSKMLVSPQAAIQVRLNQSTLLSLACRFAYVGAVLKASIFIHNESCLHFKKEIQV